MYNKGVSQPALISLFLFGVGFISVGAAPQWGPDHQLQGYILTALGHKGEEKEAFLSAQMEQY